MKAYKHFQIFTVLIFITSLSWAVNLTVIETFESDSIYVPIKIIKEGEQIFLLDKYDQAVKVFSRTGKLLKTFGRKGNGPGEFQNATDFLLADEQILVLDSHKIEVFTRKDGRHKETKRLIISSPLKFCKHENEIYVSSLSAAKEAKIINKYLDNGKLEPVNAFIEAAPMKGSMLDIYKNFGALTIWKDNIYFAFMISNQVQVFSREGNPVETLAIPFHPIQFKELQLKQTSSGLRLNLDKGIVVETCAEKDGLYVLCYDENKKSVIFKLSGNSKQFQEVYSIEEQLLSLDFYNNEIWTIGSKDDLSVLVYQIPNPAQTQE